MKILQKICFVLLLTTFSSVYGGSCWEGDVNDCRVRAKSGFFTKGNADAQYKLGEMYYDGQVVPRDYKEAVKWHRKSAAQGHSGAQNNLGWMYFNGLGVPKDYKEAVKWYTKSAKQGYSLAQFELSRMYETGQGVLQDYVMAHMYSNIAAVREYKGANQYPKLAIEKKMTSSQLAEAQKLAREWIRTHQ
jgi:TPR repeat protein